MKKPLLKINVFIKALWLITIFIAFNYNVTSQTIPKPSACVNMDFSMGNFTNWVGHTSVWPDTIPGTKINTNCTFAYYNTGIVNGRQTIMTAATADINTCNNVLTIPAGEKFAVRLGNGGNGTWGPGNGWQKDYLSYAFSVNSSNALLTYKYAVLLQDSSYTQRSSSMTSHGSALQPRFIVSIKDTATNMIDSLCGFFKEISDANYIYCRYTPPGVIAATIGTDVETIYKPWTTASVDLRSYIGHTITVQFETWDCGLGAHFGYAYFTARCDSFAITRGCGVKGGVLLTAPAGFKYKWIPSNDTTQSIEVLNGKTGDQIEVVLTNKNGCSSNLKAIIYSVIKNKITQNGNIFTAIGGLGYQWFKDGVPVNAATAQNFLTRETGNYFVQVRDSNECISNSDTIAVIINSIREMVAKHNFSVHPNPGSGLFTFEFKEKLNAVAAVEIHSLTGQKVCAFKIGEDPSILKQTIDLENYPAGIYTVHISYMNTVWTQKLVKI